MTLIDSSAWIEFLRDGNVATADAVEALLRSGGALTEPVVMEVLAGARSGRHGEQIRTLLGTVDLLPVTAEDWATAALLYRMCRVNGATIRSMVDCLIASVAIRNDVPVLAEDRDFEALAAHTPLRLAA
ncbi:MAG TPA: PIN domain nuclease [Acidimicrobiales bacterium]|nr:PIN domain nuclease [Acidimicrobiales bacterium]